MRPVGFGHELLIRFAHKYSRPRLGHPRFASQMQGPWAFVLRILLSELKSKNQNAVHFGLTFYVRPVGFEPTTIRLRGGCSTS